MAAISLISIVRKNFQLLTSQSLGLQFSECQWKWDISIGHYEKIEKWLPISLISIVQKNLQLLTPQSFGSLVFWVSMEIAYQCWPLWKNWKMAAISLISIVRKNFQLRTPPKVWVSGFPSVNRNGISVLAIMKKLKNGCHFFNIDHTEKFPITNPPQSLGLQFSECWQKWHISVGHYEKKWKMAAISLILIVRKNFQITDSPKVWVSSFQSVNRNGTSVLAIMKKLKNGCHFFNIDCTEKFPITDPHKVWVSSFLSVDGNGISVSAIMKKLKNGCHFFNINLFPITNIFAWWPFCTQKTGDTNFLSIQFSKLSHQFSFPHHPS